MIRVSQGNFYLYVLAKARLFWRIGDEVHGLARRQLKIVRLLEPELCFDCRFAHMADVESEDGSMKRMIYCKRLDCDNWDFSASESAKSVRIHEEDEAA